jgi:hypothetical protein
MDFWGRRILFLQKPIQAFVFSIVPVINEKDKNPEVILLQAVSLQG